MPSITRVFSASCSLAIAAAAGARRDAQDDVAKFYKGKTVKAVVGYGPGSTFELYLRI